MGEQKGVCEEKANWSSFWSLLVLQAQNAFNDKSAQFLLIPLGAWLAQDQGVAWAGYAEYFLAVLLLVPYIAFAPTAGWLSDRFPKQRVILAVVVAQSVLLTVLVLAHEGGWFAYAVLCFFLLALQSTVLSPAKLGILKELVGSQHLGFANGMMQMATILAILGGQILYGWWFSVRLERGGDGWAAAGLPLQVLLGASLIPLVAVCFIKSSSGCSAESFRLRILGQHFHDLGLLWKERRLRLAALGVAWFWAFGGLNQLTCVQMAKGIHGGDAGFAALLSGYMAAAGFGVALGSVLSAMWCRHRVELGLVPLAGTGMMLSCAFLALVSGESSFVFLGLFAAGMCSATFLVPLQAFVQDEAEEQRRGRVLAASGVLNCLGGVLAVLLQFLLNKLGVSVAFQFALTACFSFFALVYVTRLLPRSLLIVLVRALLSACYKTRVYGVENVPRRGGVLLLPNHVSYLDFLLLAVCSPRPVRVLMSEDFYKKAWLGWFARFFYALPISSTHSKDSLRVAAQALRDGEVLCIFPEGQLSRTGGISALQRGYGLLARRSGCAVVPVYLEGLWGSFFSFANRGYFVKGWGAKWWKRRRVGVLFGENMRGKDLSARALYGCYQSLGAKALAAKHHPNLGGLGSWMLMTPEPLGWDDAAREILEADETRRAKLFLEARRLASCGLLQKDDVLLLLCDMRADWGSVLGLILPRLIGFRLVVLDDDSNLHEVLGTVRLYEVNKVMLLGGKRMDLLQALQADVEVYMFGSVRDLNCFTKERSIGNGRTYVGLCEEGRFLSFSIPHPKKDKPQAQFQPGWKEGSMGKLLPGVLLTEIEELGLDVDEDGFLFLRESFDLLSIERDTKEIDEGAKV